MTIQRIAVTLAALACVAPAWGDDTAAWKTDHPGRVHFIDPADLAPPGATPSAANFPRVVEKPADAQLAVPAGFAVNVFSTEVKGPRAMEVAPNGDIFVSETRDGKVVVMRPSADGTTAAQITVFAEGLDLPNGIQFYPAGDHPKWVYVAETNRVVRYPYRVGDTKARGAAEVVVAQLAPSGGGHYTRDIAFSRDGNRMFVSVGSESNVAKDMPTKSPSEIEAWEAEHGVGAAWGKEENRAEVRVFDVGSQSTGKAYATGIRNCVALTVQPATNDLWCTTNERDLLGNNLVPDYSTRVHEGGFYGWPWYYIGNHEDPRHAGARPDLAGKAIVPDVLYQSHSAALDLVFYTAQGAHAFPKEYDGDAFAVFHGSWNRAERTGSKVVRVLMNDGKPTGQYVDFMVGFIVDDGHVWGRPVSAVVASDGSLLVSEDGNNRIYRISYQR